MGDLVLSLSNCSGSSRVELALVEGAQESPPSTTPKVESTGELALTLVCCEVARVPG